MTDQSPQDVEILEKQTAYKGFFQVHKYRLRHQTFAGGWTDVMERELFARRPAVGVLLYDPRLDVVVLIEQFRIGALGAGINPWMLEVVAGIIDGENESPEDVARREAMEEAGRTITRLEKLYDFLPSPGGCDERVILYCGQVDAVGAGGIHGLAAEHEDIKVVVLPVAEAIRRMDENRIGNCTTISALAWLARFHQDLRRRWLADLPT